MRNLIAIVEGVVDITSLVPEILEAFPKSKEIWFHGSRARGDHRKNSDWDILVLYDSKDVANKLDAVLALQPLQLKAASQNIDIQTDPLSSKDREGTVAWWAKKEGRLLWKD